ncbi:hypothetical protein FBD94_20330 [Pedobacter hiemivivus]|uniref:DUF7674 domain-containing protein n=1 Tax=Pedobacter hiemivivus TaxID=2530454 RepID=A0A4V5PF24_9SPHI|nr:hypothetical protein [Pedobacter hiemivivus]TKC57626.1 hypothetical protein FBD94_20330 [Pedobacter hiemivivus]
MNEIDNFICKVLKSLLFEMVPEYAKGYSKEDVFQEGIYFFMNDFAMDLGRELSIDNSSSFVKNAFKYINLLGESNNLEILNIVTVGILEILYTTEFLNRNMVSGLLCEKLKIHFNRFSDYYQ